MSFDPLKLATPIIKRVDYNFKSRTRAHVRLPIIMNGAGPAGLILAIGLQNANIPFEICETQRHDLPSKRRSNQVSLLERTTLAPLKKFLKDLSYESILDNVRVNTFPTRLEARGDAVHIKTEALLAMLRSSAEPIRIILHSIGESGTATHLTGNTRLALVTNGAAHGGVNMSLDYSRLTRSDDDHYNYWGTWPTERDVQTVQYDYDPMIAGEIQSFQPLPPPFAAAFELCRDSSVSMKSYLNAVRMERSDLATEVYSGGLSMPAVLIGDAAHAIPRELSKSSINRAIWDAFDLCSMIVERYDNDTLFSRITKDYYDLKSREWQAYPIIWAKDWLTAHGLPYDSVKAQSTWVKLARPTHRLARQVVPETQGEGLFEGDKNRYRKQERARLAVIEQRIRDRLERRYESHIPPGVDPTKLVIRYLDSRPLPEVAKDYKDDREDEKTSNQTSGSSHVNTSD